mgnify:CR=1 FL=1
MEQLVARRAHNPKVTGSSPVPATKSYLSRFTISESAFFIDMQQEVFTVYILYSIKSRIFYYGYTSDLIKRYHDHNFSGFHSFTARHRPWVVLYNEMYYSRKDAILREKYFKSGQGRAFVKNHIAPIYLNLF